MADENELDIAIENELSRAETQDDSLDGLAPGEPGPRGPALGEAERELVRLAVYLRDTTPQAPPGCREHTWERVRTRMATRNQWRQITLSSVWPSMPLVSRVAAVLVGSLVVASVAVGTVAAHSLPDTPLYPVKLAMEQGQLALTLDASSRAKLRISHAEKRLEEVVALDNEGKGINSQALDAMLLATTEASEQMAIVDDPAQREAVSVDFDRFVTAQETTLTTLLQRAPEPAKEGLQRALQESQKAKGKDKGRQQDESQPGLGRDGAPGQEKKPAPAEAVDEPRTGPGQKSPRDVPPPTRGGRDKPAVGSKSHK